MSITFFSEIGEIYTTATKALVSDSVSSLISAITPVATTGVIIYFMITGYMVIAGRISEPIGDVLIKCFKIGLVATLCLNVSGIMNYVVGSVDGIEQILLSSVSKGGDSTNVFKLLDQNIENTMLSIGSITEADDAASWYDFGTHIQLSFSILIVLVAAIVITVVGAALLILAKVALAIILALSPFFILGLAFPVTAKFFDSWFSQALNYILVGVLVILVCSFAMNSYQATIDGLTTAIKAGATFPTSSLFKLLVLAAVNAAVLKTVPTISQGLAGGMASAGASLTGMLVGARGAANMATLGGTDAIGRGIGRLQDKRIDAAGKRAAKLGKRAASAGKSAVRYAADGVQAISSRVNRIRNITSRK